MIYSKHEFEAPIGAFTGKQAQLADRGLTGEPSRRNIVPY
jgi:hypothetical protein